MRTGTARVYIYSADQITDSIITQPKLSGAIAYVKARAYVVAADQAIAATTWTKVRLDGETYDTQGAFDPVTNYRYTVAAAASGYYLIHASLNAYNTAAAGYAIVAIYKNGALLARASAQLTLGVQGLGVRITDYFPLVAADYVEIFVYFENAGAIFFGEMNSWLDIARIF